MNSTYSVQRSVIIRTVPIRNTYNMGYTIYYTVLHITTCVEESASHGLAIYIYLAFLPDVGSTLLKGGYINCSAILCTPSGVCSQHSQLAQERGMPDGICSVYTYIYTQIYATNLLRSPWHTCTTV
jgi:hypothetical protein